MFLPEDKLMLRLEFKFFSYLRCWLAVFLLLGFAPRSSAETMQITPGTNWVFEATNHLGQWIWDTNTFDKQTCRLWKSFEIPAGAKVASAILAITVDNGYSLFLDGREIGRGSDWRTVTKYDVTRLLNPGRHFLAVEGFNDRLEAGLIFGLHIELVDQRILDVLSDKAWFVVSENQRNWTAQKKPQPNWHPAIVVGAINHHPWEVWPYGLTSGPMLLPLIVHFWQTGWFQLSLFIICAFAVLFCIWLATRLAAQSRAQEFLHIERARIARDIHDDLGAQLTQLVLLGEVAQSEQPENSSARGQFNQICQQARDLSQAMDEVVWAVNSRRDTVRDFASYVCKYAQIFFNATITRCRLDVEPEMPATEFELPVRRNLFLAVKEALNNVAKHAQAEELFLRIYRHEQKLVVTIEDNGIGFDAAALNLERNGMTNMAQRMAEISGTCEVFSQPGTGCSIVFSVPLKPAESRLPFRWLRRDRAAEATRQIENLHLPAELVKLHDHETK